MLDVLVVGTVLAFCVMGYFRGILRQGLTVCALLISYFVSAYLAGPFAPSVMELWHVSEGMAHTIGRALGGVLVFLSLSLAARQIDRRIGRTRSGRPLPWNSNLGGLAGLAFGALLAFCILCLADAFCKAYPQPGTWWLGAVKRSYFRTWVEPNNPADRFLVTDSLTLIRHAHTNPETFEKLGKRKEIQALLDEPIIQEILDDPELMEAIRRQDLARVAADERIHRLLTDPELRKKIFSPEVRGAVGEVTRELEAEDSQDAQEPAQGTEEPEAPDED